MIGDGEKWLVLDYGKLLIANSTTYFLTLKMKIKWKPWLQTLFLVKERVDKLAP